MMRTYFIIGLLVIIVAALALIGCDKEIRRTKQWEATKQETVSCSYYCGSYLQCTPRYNSSTHSSTISCRTVNRTCTGNRQEIAHYTMWRVAYVSEKIEMVEDRETVAQLTECE